MKQILLALVLTLAVALPVRAQVTFDASASTATAASGWSHTVTGTNTVLLVAVSYSAQFPGYETGVSWNGQSLTRLVNAIRGTGGGLGSEMAINVWYLVGATAGTATVTLIGAGVGLQGGVSLSYRNVLQTVPVGPIPGLLYQGQFNGHSFGPLQMPYDGADAPGGLAVMAALINHVGGLTVATPAPLLNDSAIAVSIDTTNSPGLYLAFVTAPVKRAGGPLGLGANGGVLSGGNGFNDWMSVGLLLAPLASYAVVGK